MKLTDPQHFRPLVPPRVVRAITLGGTPVLHLGDWVDSAGRVVGVQVCSMSTRLSPIHITEFPAPPAPQSQEMPDDAHPV